MILPPEVPRIYTSFAEFERDELARLGLDASPALLADPPATESAPASVPIPVSTTRALSRPTASRPRACISIDHVTHASLIAMRAEGVLEIGSAAGTSVLFVRTRQKLHLLHTTWLPERQLDDYAVSLAVTWIEGHGMPSCEVAKNLGVSETTLRHALTAAGYERLSPERHEQLGRARSARKFGNRRGRLVLTAPRTIDAAPP